MYMKKHNQNNMQLTKGSL